MTALGRFYKAHPNGHDPADQGMCPDQFGYLDPPENCNALHGLSEFPELMSCKECWLREIPEENADASNAKTKPDFGENTSGETNNCALSPTETRDALKLAEQRNPKKMCNNCGHHDGFTCLVNKPCYNFEHYIPKENHMFRNATTQCVNCSHSEVCKYRQALATVSLAVTDALSKLEAEDDPNAKGMDLSFVYQPIEVKCKYRYATVETAYRSDDLVGHNAHCQVIG